MSDKDLKAEQREADWGAKGGPARGGAPEPQVVEHTVAAGETLSKIAQQYYGAANRWQEIYEANKQTIGPNPNQLRVGQVLQIPK